VTQKIKLEDVVADRSVFIALTACESLWDLKHPSMIFLNEGVQRYSRQNIWKKYSVQLLHSPLQDSYTFKKANSTIKKAVPVFTRLLGMQLNSIHQRRYSQAYWDVLLGSWAVHYITIIYDRYVSIKHIIKTYNNWETILLAYNSFSTPDNFKSFLDDVVNSDVYNHQLYTQIVEYLGYGFEKKSVDVEFKKAKNPQSLHWAGKIKQMVWNCITFILNKSAKWFSSRVLFMDAYIPDKLLLSLFIKSRGRCIPIKYQGSLRIDSQVDSDMREKLRYFGESVSDPFITLLIHLLPINMPKAFLEDFQYYEHKVKIEFPQHPQCIVTSLGLYTNEYSRFWLAQMKERHIPINGVQHGGVYGCAEYQWSEYIEAHNCISFYTWGWKNTVFTEYSHKIHPFFMMKHAKKKNVRSNPSGKILLGTTVSFRYLYRLNNVNYFDMPRYFDWQFQFIEALSKSAQSQLVVRLYQLDKGWGIKQKYNDRSPNIALEHMLDIPFFDSLSQSKLYIADHCSTTFLEALVYNIPTLLFWNPNVETMRDAAKPYFDELVDAGILHYSPESAAKTVNRIQNSVAEWWSDSKRQNAVNHFCHQFARQSDDPINDLMNAFVNTEK